MFVSESVTHSKLVWWDIKPTFQMHVWNLNQTTSDPRNAATSTGYSDFERFINNHPHKNIITYRSEGKRFERHKEKTTHTAWMHTANIKEPPSDANVRPKLSSRVNTLASLNISTLCVCTKKDKAREEEREKVRDYKWRSREVKDKRVQKDEIKQKEESDGKGEIRQHMWGEPAETQSEDTPKSWRWPTQVKMYFMLCVFIHKA